MEDEEEGVLEERSRLPYPRQRTKVWVDKEGNFHRLNGPAVIYYDGDREWYRHGELHRDDGPAFEWPSENKFKWYKDGEFYEPSAHDLMVWKMKLKITQDFM